VNDFDPIPRLQQIAATIEDGGHFDSPATAAHYINCAIREIERLRQEYGEARRAIGESLQTLIHIRQEQNALRAERDEARREVCKWECRCRPMSELDYAASRKWKCFPPRKMFEDLKP
jgi:hypothetical protein